MSLTHRGLPLLRVCRDLEFIKGLEVDWVALSFVQRPGDIDELRALAGTRLRVMAKLEKPAAMDCLHEVRHSLVYQCCAVLCCAVF